MKLTLTIAALFLTLSSVAPVGIGQQTTCSCEKAPARTCRESVTCNDGCSALCGSQDTCLLSCGSDLIYVRITLKLSKKKGEEIASVLSDQTKKKIEFAPYPRNAHTRYDLEIKGDDIWNVLSFLDKLGNVKVGGVDFPTLRKLHKEMRTDRKVSMNFIGISAKGSVTMLAHISGSPLNEKSGDPEGLVSISLKEIILSEMVTRLSSEADGKVDKKRDSNNRKRHGRQPRGGIRN